MRNRFALFVVGLLATTAPALAGETVLYGPAPKWAEVRDAAKIDTAANTPIALLDVQQRIEGETLRVYVDQAFKLGSPESLTQSGTSSAVWMPDKGDLTVHRVEILRAGKVIDVLKGGARYQVLRRERGLEQRQIDGMLTATLAIPGLQVGDVVRIAYSQTMRDKALQGKVQIDSGLLTLPLEAGFARTSVSWPEGLAVKWQAGPAAGNPTESVKDGWHTVNVALPLAKREEMPQGVPSRFTRPPTLEATTFGSWEEVSRVFAPLYSTKDAIAPGSPLAAEVAKIEKQSADPLTRAALATRLVQDQVSYLLNGMAGGNYVPQAPSLTWTSRYGDCKAKSLLLLSLLEALGIKAEVVAVNSQTGDAVPESLPMPAAFDHVIVRAEIAGETYWLDGTATGTRIATIADVPPFRFALPIRAEGAPLMTIAPRLPQLPAGIVKMTIDQRAGIDMPALVTVTTTFSGMLGSNFGAALGQASADQKKQILGKMADSLFKSLTDDGGLVTDGSTSFDSETGTATVNIKGIVVSLFGDRDGTKRMDMRGLSSATTSFDYDRSRANWKALPVSLGSAERVIEEMEVLLPPDEPGFKLGGKPDYEVSFAGNTVTRKGQLEGQRFTVSEERASLGGELPAAEIATEKAKALRLRNTVPFLVAPVSAARAWRYQTAALKARLAPIEAAYAQALLRETGDAQADPLVRRADLRESVFDLEGAVADWDKAIGLTPDAWTYSRRGYTKRQMGRLEEAIADFREALKLAPSASNAMTLAAALGQSGKTEEALALLSEYDDMGDEHSGVVQTRADVLAYAGRGDEGLKEINGLIDERPGDTSLLNASCWYRARFRVGTDVMMDVCNQATERASNPAAVLDSRALAWVAQGNLASALADTEAALKIWPSQIASQYLKAWIGNAMGKPEAKADLAYFRKVAPGLVQDYARYGLK
ncbi:DUF3857 domain-containing protein [Novosphingobium sp. CCH12-A3]|uniref:DUF3857 domain-containing protein n=1 Tax=Novosphingobium sp. CCH12-A3 TaxID=1768752 RepID=UPI0007825F01|nr:DUF3857 domain-containing protein [Novosphingobium sp. CCH12-A3]